MDNEIDLNAPIHPGAVPEVMLAELLQFSPVIQELILGVESALSTGSVSVPAIRIKVHGERLTLGPIPVALEKST